MRRDYRSCTRSCDSFKDNGQPMFDVITIDLDDTLWDARPALLQAEEVQYAWIVAHAPRIAAALDNEAVRRRRWELAARHPEAAHDFTRLRVLALAELLREFAYDPALAEPGVAAFVRARSAVTLFADVAPSLSDLRRDHTLVALTNGNADLAVAGVSDYFAFCISPAEAGVQKPDPRMFAMALARAGVDPARAVHVGDQPLHDVEGARRAAVRSVWLNRNGSVWPGEYPRPHMEISSLLELRGALAALAGTSTR